MYNGIEAAAVKGTGLSGYVQRSKANVSSQVSRFRAVAWDEEAPPVEPINPLLQKRSQKENQSLARRLEAHKAIRAVHLKVLLYREERAARGVEPDMIKRECKELYESLMDAAAAAQRGQQKLDDQKTAERFAQAFGLKSGSQTFDRASAEEAKRVSEEERRKQREHQLVEKLKRARQEAAGHHAASD